MTVRRRGRAAARLGLVVTLGAAGLAAAAVAAAPGASAATTATFSYTGAEQAYPVPAGVTAVTVHAVGAPGGIAYQGGAGGAGADVTATITFPAGTTTLYVEVGGRGPNGPGFAVAPGAFNGGGANTIYGGGGGGASDVRPPPSPRFPTLS